MQRGFHLSPSPLSLVVLSMNVETKSTLRYEGLIAYSLVAYYVYPKCLVRGGRLILGVVVSGGTAAEQHSYLLLLLPLPILLLLTPPDVLCKTVFTPSAFASWLVPYLCLCLPRAEYQPVGLTSAERSVVQNDSLSVGFKRAERSRNVVCWTRRSSSPATGGSSTSCWLTALSCPLDSSECFNGCKVATTASQ